MNHERVVGISGSNVHGGGEGFYERRAETKVDRSVSYSEFRYEEGVCSIISPLVYSSCLCTGTPRLEDVNFVIGQQIHRARRNGLGDDGSWKNGTVIDT